MTNQAKQDLWQYLTSNTPSNSVALERSLLDRIATHKLGVILRDYIKEIAPQEHIEASLRVLFQKYLNAAFKLEISTLFDGAVQQGIKLLYCKGLVLSESLYSAPEERICGDIDVLVDIADLPAMLTLLGELGYIHNPSGKPVTSSIADSMCESPVLVEIGELYRFVPHTQSRVKMRVDLHVSLFIKDWQNGVNDARQMLTRAVQGKVLDHQVWLLERHDQLVHLLVHFAVHHTYVGFIKVFRGGRWFTEMDKLFEIASFLDTYTKEISWEILLERVRSFHVEQEVYFTLRLVNRIYSHRVPPQILGALQQLSSAISNTQLNEVMPLQHCLPVLLQLDPDWIIHTELSELLQNMPFQVETATSNGAESQIIVSNSEREAEIRRWNQTARDYLLDRPLHRWVEEQVARTPDAQALIFEDTHLTYTELNARANQLAHTLHALGIGPNSIVGVCMERSLELVIALLAVLKAGGAYLPLDPAYPTDRLSFMLTDAQASVILTQFHLQDRLPTDHTVIVLPLDQAGAQVVSPMVTNLEVAAASSDLAYVIYTSGSTGKPKGVLCHHRGIVNRLLWMQEAYHLTAQDRVLQKTPYSFDVSVWEFFWPLITGATLVIARPEGHRDSTYLVEVIKRERITTLHFVPPMLAAFLDDPGAPTCETIRQIICSGEALSYELQERCFARLGTTLALHNLYGPTEAAVDVSAWTCQPHDPRRLVPIGHPIANTQLYVLDEHLQPVPQGVAGELYIGGVQVAHGYLNRPELTAARFLPDPFHADPTARLYKTGDQVRRLADGAIAYLGRLDYQVKLRGFRIELGEIEAVLRQHPQVREAVVQVWEPTPDSKRLVAYLVLDSANPEPIHVDNSGHTLAHIAAWQTLYDDLYGQTAKNDDATLNLLGWNSSYTGKPLSDDEMLEWVNQTVSQIIAIQPRRVLEIGCGTGLLLFRIAPNCEFYHGTDLSQTVLSSLAHHLAKLSMTSLVTLGHMAADDARLFENGPFDTVILNSVVQCFPSLHYFSQVLERIITSFKDKGVVFIGDLRNLPLLEAFHSSVQFHQAPDDLTVDQLRHRVKARIEQENELVIDPEFFYALQNILPAISHVDIRLKTGCFENELSRFRYDVLLTVDKHSVAEPHISLESLDWQHDALTIDNVATTLHDTTPDVLIVRNIPNGRVQSMCDLVSVLHSCDAPLTVGALRDLHASQTPSVDPTPNTLCVLGESLGYQVTVYWPISGHIDTMDAVFKRPAMHLGVSRAREIHKHPTTYDRPLSDYANTPRASSQDVNTLEQILRAHVAAQLPDYMVPSHILLLDQMPLSLNGKINRSALPRPLATRDAVPDPVELPVNTEEQRLADIWSKVLGIRPIGRHDNFFDLGGDSLSSVRVVAEARQHGLHFIPANLLQYPTIASLTANLHTVTPIAAEQEVVEGPVILTPNQHVSFETHDPDRHLWVASLLWETPADLNTDHLRTAVQELMVHHDALRLRSQEAAQGWKQWIDLASAETPLVCFDLSSYTSEQQRVLIEDNASLLMSSLQVTTGPLLRVAHFSLGQGVRGRLLFIVHHIICDGFSRRILLDDLFTAYQQLCQAQPVKFPPKTTSLRAYAQRLYDHAQTSMLYNEILYWSTPARRKIQHLPTDHLGGIPRGSTLRTVTRRLDATTSLTVVNAAEREGIQVNDILLANLVEACSFWTGSRCLLVDVEHHGRETPFMDIDLSRTVGWISYCVPTLLDLEGQEYNWDAVRSIRQQQQQIPNYGIGHGLLRYLCQEETTRAEIRKVPSPEIHFNFLGARSVSDGGRPFDATTANEVLRAPGSSQVILRHTLMIDIKLFPDGLEMVWTYSEAIHHQITIEELVDRYFTSLKMLVAQQ